MKERIIVALAILSSFPVLPWAQAAPKARFSALTADDAVYDVRTFRAVGDGTDESTRLQNAATAAIGKVLYIPSGLTFYGKNLSIGANTTITGGGTLKLYPLSKGDGSPVLNIRGDNVVIDGIRIDGNKSAQPADGFSDSYDQSSPGTVNPNGRGRSYRAAINADAVRGGTKNGLTVRNCFIYNTYGSPIATRNVDEVSIVNNRGLNNNFEFAFLYSSNDGHVNKNAKVMGNSINNTGSRDATVNGNGFLISFYNGAVFNSNIADNTERNLLKLERCANVMVSGNTSRKNTIYGGIQLQSGGSNITITGNTLVDMHCAGVFLSGGGLGYNNIVVSNNTIDKTHPPSALCTTPDGIIIGADNSSTTNVDISGNIISNIGRFGVYLAGGRNINISGNRITAGRGAKHGIWVTNQFLMSDVSISGNIISGFGGQITVFPVSSTTIINNFSIVGNVLPVGNSSIAGIRIFGDIVTNGIISKNISSGTIETVGNVYIPDTNVVSWTIVGNIKTNPDGDNTVDVSNYQHVEINNTNPTWISSITGGHAGQAVTMTIFDANTTFVNGASLILAGGKNWAAGVNDSISFIKRVAGAWIETGRSVH